MKLFFKFSKSIPLAFIICIFSIFSVSAQQAKKISLQGFLKDANGKAVADGSQVVIFKLYTQESGGTFEWSETQTLNVFGGIYSTHLGKTESLENLNWGANTYYVGVTVQGTELIPRTELTFAPYSLGSPKAQEVVCSGAVGDVKYSILNPTQFAAVNGSCWVPMDGRALLTSDKLRIITSMTNLPDAGGSFLRSQEFQGGADRDPDRTANSTIATLQDDTYKSHNHGGNTESGGIHAHNITDPGHSHVWNFGLEGDDSGSGGSYAEYTRVGGEIGDAIRRATTGITINTDGNHTHSINSQGGNETRPKNLNLWTYIRIN